MMTIATFTNPEEAHLFRMRLGAAGINAYVIDENMVQAYWLYSNAIGGVRVQIDEEDLPAVEEFLKSDVDVESTEEEEEISCPECGSSFVEYDETSRRVALFTVALTAVPLPFSKQRWRCTSCNHHWKLTGAEDDEAQDADSTS